MVSILRGIGKWFIIIVLAGLILWGALWFFAMFVAPGNIYGQPVWFAIRDGLENMFTSRPVFSERSSTSEGIEEPKETKEAEVGIYPNCSFEDENGNLLNPEATRDNEECIYTIRRNPFAPKSKDSESESEEKSSESSESDEELDHTLAKGEIYTIPSGNWNCGGDIQALINGKWVALHDDLPDTGLVTSFNSSREIRAPWGAYCAAESVMDHATMMMLTDCGLPNGCRVVVPKDVE